MSINEKYGEGKYGEFQYGIPFLSEEEIQERIMDMLQTSPARILFNIWSDFYNLYYEDLYQWVLIWDGFYRVLEDLWLKLYQYNLSKSLDAAPTFIKGRWDYFDLSTPKADAVPIIPFITSQILLPDQFSDNVRNKKWHAEYTYSRTGIFTSEIDLTYPAETNGKLLFLFEDWDPVLPSDESYPVFQNVASTKEYEAGVFRNLAKTIFYPAIGKKGFESSVSMYPGTDYSTIDTGRHTFLMKFISPDQDNYEISIGFIYSPYDGFVERGFTVMEEGDNIPGIVHSLAGDVPEDFLWEVDREYQITFNVDKENPNTFYLKIYDPISNYTIERTGTRHADAPPELDNLYVKFEMRSQYHEESFQHVHRLNKFTTNMKIPQDQLVIIYPEAPHIFPQNPKILEGDSFAFDVKFFDHDHGTLFEEQRETGFRKWNTEVIRAVDVPEDIQLKHPDLYRGGPSCGTYFRTGMLAFILNEDNRQGDEFSAPNYNASGIDATSGIETTAYFYDIDDDYVSIPVLQDAIEDRYVGKSFVESQDFTIVRRGVLKFFKAEPPEKLFAPDVFRDEENLFNNFGFMIDFPGTSTEKYKNSLLGLYYSFWNGPTITNLRNGLNIALGLPFAYEKETVRSITISGDVYIIDTGQNVYEVDQQPAVVEGQTIEPFTPLVLDVRVVDYLSEPGWWRNEDLHPMERFFTFGAFVDHTAFTAASDFDMVRTFLEKSKPSFTHYILGIVFDKNDIFPETDDSRDINVTKYQEDDVRKGAIKYGDGHAYGDTGIWYGGRLLEDELSIIVDGCFPFKYGLPGLVYGGSFMGIPVVYGGEICFNNVIWPL